MAQNMLAVPARRVGDFWIFWTGQTISQIGSTLTATALPLLVFKLSGSALDLGLASAATWVPYPLFGLFIGAWVDRVNRKGLMIGLDIARAAVLAVLPALALFGHLPIWWIYLVTFINSTLTVGFQGATNAAIPSLVDQDDLLKANGRIQASAPFATIVGPLLAALLLTATSLQVVLWCDALTFVISAISLALIKTSFNAVALQARPKTSLRRDILEGLRYVLAQPVVRTMALFSLLANLAVAVLFPQIVFYAKEVLFASDAQVSQFFTAAGIGAVILMLSAGFLHKRLSYGVILLGSILLSGVSVLVMIAARLYWVDLVCFGVMFGLVGLYDVAFDTILQAIAPNQLLGRVLTFTSVVAIFSVPLSSILGGAVIDQVKNVLLIFGILGAFLIVLALVFVRSPLTHVEGYLPPKPVDDAQDAVQ
ncbi:MAG TPA: MFS transporter [Ktedonobacteraceae bacterium]